MQDELAIRAVKQSYFHGVDSHDWALFGSVFAEDAVFDMSAATDPSEPLIVGRKAIVDFVRTTMSPITSVHHGFLRTLDFQGADHAQAIWAMEDILWREEDGKLRKFLHAYGHYHEDYRKIDGQWKYTKVRLTRVAVETW